MDTYRQHINKKFSQSLKTTHQLHSWTVANQQPFWLDLYGYLELVPPLPTGMTRAYDESLPMSSVPPFFEGLELNYAENVLGNAKCHPKNVALIGLREGQDLDGDVEKVTWRALKERVRKASNGAQKFLGRERRCGRSACEQFSRGCGVVSEYCGSGSCLHKY
jgi:acetoacetyl-CoA synthetase